MKHFIAFLAVICLLLSACPISLAAGAVRYLDQSAAPVPELERCWPDSVTLKYFSGYEYKMDDGAWQQSTFFSDLVPGSTHRFYQRVAETDTVCAGESSDPLTVTLDETPVKSLTINDMTIVENTGGYYSEELGYYIYADSLWPSGTVELKDGRRISFNVGGLYIDGEWYDMPTIDPPSQKDAPWTVGNSYEVTGNFLGVSTVFRVTIVPCPIESVSIGEVKVIAGTHGYENENGQYIYTTGFASVPFSVKMRDGRVLTSPCGRIGIDETWYELKVDLPDQTKDPWTVGSTHTLTAYIGDVSCSFHVTVIDDPIESMSIDPVICAEGTWGDYDYEKGYFRYGNDFWYQSFSVTLKDGTVVQSGVRVPATYNCSLNKGGDPLTLTLYGMNYGALLFDDTQDETHWGVGEHYVTGTLSELDIAARMKVTVTESPVERLQIEDMLYVPGGESWRNLRPVYTLYFKDGTKKTVTDDAEWITPNGMYESLDINDSRQELADGETYEMTGSFGHLTDTFRVTVAAGIIRSLQLVSSPDKTAYTVGECFDVRGAVLRVGYSDGTSEDVALNNSGLHTAFEQAICLRKLNATVTVSWSGKKMLKAGQQKATITLLGKSVECPIKVTGSSPRALTARVDADMTPIFTMTYSDGKTVDLRLLDFRVFGGYSDLDVGDSAGYIETDKGLFAYSWEEGVFTIGGAQSNVFRDTEWFRRYQTACRYSGDSLLPTLRFSGQLTAENIDGLIGYFYGLWSAEGNGAQIRKRLQETCGISNADLSLSKHYDPATDTYFFTDMLYRITHAAARRLTYQNGTWTMWAQFTDGTTYRATFDGDGCLLRLNAPGDLDSDGEVTDWDGVLLARYLAGWTMDAQDAAMLDIDGDGEITDWDGVLLDRYLAGWDVTL